MMCSRRSWLVNLMVLGGLAALPASAAFAQADYPNKPLRIVVGFAPGGSNDIVARLLAEKLQKSWGQPAIVENKPGGGGAVAAAFVKSQPADGYTLMVGASGAMVVGPAIGAPASYETLADFEPVSILGTFPLVVIVNAEVAAQDAEGPRHVDEGQSFGFELCQRVADVHAGGGAPETADRRHRCSASPIAAPTMLSWRCWATR